VTAVFFGGIAAQSFSVFSDGALFAVAPPEAAGTVEVQVTTPAGTSSGGADTYTYQDGGGFASPAPRTVTWVGGSGDWSAPSHWSTGALPGANDDVVIPVGVTVTHSAGSDGIHGLTVQGALLVSGGTLTLNAAASVATLTVSGGTLTGPGALTVTASFTWTGGTLAGRGTTTLTAASTATLSAGGGTLALWRGLTSAGTVTWVGAGILQFLGGAGWTNSGTFQAQPNGAAQNVTGAGIFRNTGTFVESSAGSTSFAAGVTFYNPGVVQLNAGTLSLGTGTSTGTVTAALGAVLRLASYTLAAGSLVNGQGSVVFAGGASTLGGTVSASGGVRIESGAAVRAAGATVNASLTNAGAPSVGLGAAGALTVNGDYSQTSTGSLNVVIGGLTAKSQYSQLQVSGQATLAGTVNVTFVNGFTPAPGNAFALLTCGSRSGTFATVRGTTLRPQYDATDFSLLALLAPLDRPEEAPGRPAVDEAENAAPLREEAVASAAPAPAPFEGAEEPPALALAASRGPEAARDVVFADLPEAGALAAGGDGGLDDLFALPVALLEELLTAVC
jgi:hypothetical protein